jgi:hypothetical protein
MTALSAADMAAASTAAVERATSAVVLAVTAACKTVKHASPSVQQALPSVPPVQLEIDHTLQLCKVMEAQSTMKDQTFLDTQRNQELEETRISNAHARTMEMNAQTASNMLQTMAMCKNPPSSSLFASTVPIKTEATSETATLTFSDALLFCREQLELSGCDLTGFVKPLKATDVIAAAILGEIVLQAKIDAAGNLCGKLNVIVAEFS